VFTLIPPSFASILPLFLSTFERPKSTLRDERWEKLGMSFIFRTVFWLGLAMVMLPPEARLGGGDDMAEFRDLDVGLELQNAANAVLSVGNQAANVCETNPQLCKAGGDLANAALAAATTVATDVTGQLRSEAWKTLATAENDLPHGKKIQARVE
jgi:hypothetical protein